MFGDQEGRDFVHSFIFVLPYNSLTKIITLNSMFFGFF